tara:strand:+ start:53760 stop:54344 length:585 start_codon:yes stop_codon:yes gene_type:complete
MVNTEAGERLLQTEMGSSDRACQFYDRQMRSSLTEKMVSLICRQEMVFVATADASGNCDCSPRFGNAGFVLVLDEATLAWPEYRGNGVYASLGNILENPHVGLVFLDMFDTTVGLHVNGEAHSYPESELPEILADHIEQHDPSIVATVERWVVVKIEEAYIHCSKHVPRVQRTAKQIDWGTDDPAAKSSEFFVE